MEDRTYSYEAEETNENLADTENQGVEEITHDELEELLKMERAAGKKTGAIVATLICIILGSIIGCMVVFLGGPSEKSEFIDDAFIRKSDYFWERINKDFLWEEDIDKQLAQDKMYKAIFDSLGDPYSVYYTKEEFDDLIESSNGEYSGIGAYVAQDPETKDVFISRPMPGSPAEEAGLKPNDYIIEVGGESVKGLDLNVVVSKIKGPEGSTVDLLIRHDNKGEPEIINVERRMIEVARIEHELLDDGIGYIWIYEFENNTFSQFMDAYNEMKDNGMEGLIIDLRDNPGGDLDEVCKLADVFLDEGTIVYTKDRNGKGDVLKSDAKCEKLPIVMITNSNSASASEILTGSLKYRGVATVVGNTTFGKGIVQGLYQLSDGSGYKMTETEYYLPNDECIHGKGIDPDYEVDLDYENYNKDDINTDAQKLKAIDVLKEMLK